MVNTFRGLLPDGTLPDAAQEQVSDLIDAHGLPSGTVPIFETLAEAIAWEAANPGRKALTVEPQEPDVDPPIPGVLAVSPTDITANLTVTGASDNRAVTGYSFRRGTGAWSDWQVGNTYTATGLTPDTEYTFQHKVRDGAGNESLGAAVAATTSAMSAKTPEEIGALWGHWDASAAGSLTTSGSAVSAWSDISGASRQLAQSAPGQQPSTGTLNGLTAVQFDRARQDYMRCSFSPPIDAATGYTLVAVARFADDNIAVSQTVAGPAGGVSIKRRSPDGILHSGNSPELKGPDSLKPVAGSTYMMAMVVRSGSPSRAWISGVSGEVTAAAAPNPATAFDVGRWAQGASDYLSGTVGEVWVHDRALTGAELDSLRMYAQQKWGAQ